MTSEDLERLLALGHETAGVEVKAGFSRNEDRLFWRVIRAVLAMTNHRDGGYVAIGIEERDTGFAPTGFAPGAYDTWTHDDIAAGIAPYAEPYVSFTTHRLTFGGQSVVVLHVREFDHVPVICTMDRLPELKAAVVYVRSTTKPESVAVRDHAQMRDIVDLATEKSLRRVLGMMQGAGTATLASDDELFAAQLQGLR